MFSPKDSDRYLKEFTGRRNMGKQESADQLATLQEAMIGKRLTYKDLTADNGLFSHPRPMAV